MKKKKLILTTTSSSPTIEANDDNDNVEEAASASSTAQNLEDLAVQNATQHSIRLTHGAYAVAPANNTVTSRRITSASTNGNSSSGAAAVNNDASLQPSPAVTALESSDYYSSNYSHDNNNNYLLPPNIDIIAEATLVPNPDEEETTEEINNDYDYDVASTDEVDTLGLNINDEPTRGGAHQHYSTNDTVVSEITTPAAIAPPLETLELRNSTPSTSVTTANCELVQQVNTHSCNGGESGGGGTGRTAVDSSVNPSSSINTTTPPSDQQLPEATAEPM